MDEPEIVTRARALSLSAHAALREALSFTCNEVLAAFDTGRVQGWRPSEQEAIRAACEAADVSIECTFPDCLCRDAPAIARAILALSPSAPEQTSEEKL